MKKILLLSILAMSLSACGKHSEPNFIFMPDMYWTPGLKSQMPGHKPPVAGTIPRGYEPIPAAMTMEEAGKAFKNPLTRSANVLARGKQMFNTYCIVCHGAYGEGDGSVVPKFPRPPTLQSDKIKNYPDGNIFYIISRGQNLMPSYAAQIQKPDRWAIVHYVRALQKAKNPTAADLKAAGAE